MSLADWRELKLLYIYETRQMCFGDEIFQRTNHFSDKCRNFHVLEYRGGENARGGLLPASETYAVSASLSLHRYGTTRTVLPLIGNKILEAKRKSSYCNKNKRILMLIYLTADIASR